jgi:hypothetical protein
VSGAAPQPNYARRLAFVTFLGSAAGSCLGSLVLVMFGGSVLGLRAAALIPFAILGCVGGAVGGWWYVLHRQEPPRFRYGLGVVAVLGLLITTPLLLIFIPAAWLGAGFAGWLTLKYLERAAASD